ncbi:uncharacterized protein LOC111089786 isoform X1 [Limulus polyphemus]|uniref:Uncharacterized protein LOC111089786 isoform X1 n=1 Tax=Limulus polyphemus TaxID=6850 RepID=A0ABM1TRR8_LIMPO|nr:uncharacterized protein LOC111089786 isoform X1 [Limulus polyphemus]
MMFQKKRGYYGVYIWSVILTVWFCLHVALAVKILRLSVPQSVQNGTDHVILDCEYNYTANDLRLVVKWFFNNNLEPIYQWIPKLNSRHISEMLINRLDRSYKVNSPDPYFHYRALYLLHPTLEISGKYTCQVLSLAGHDQQHQKMIVYSQAKTFSFSHTKVSSLETDISCEAMGLFPQPDISVSAILPKHFKDPFLQAPKKFVNITKELYSIWISGTFNQKDFPKTDKIVLQCEVHIPETDYKVSKELSFYTGLATVNKASLRDFFRLCYILCVVVLCYCKS